MRSLLACLILIAAPAPLPAETLRIATWNSELSRSGPGLFLRDLGRGEAADIAAAIALIAKARADILVLQEIDWDLDGLALARFGRALDAAGAPYPYRLALRPNTGMATGIDLDGDGRRGGPRDAQGYGTFAGQGGMAVLSRLPIEWDAVRDVSTILWRDLPGNLLGDGTDVIPQAAAAVQRLSSTGHWAVPIGLADGGRLWLLTTHPTPPVFDGPEDRNGRRNHDEVRLLSLLLDGWAPPGTAPLPAGALTVVLGDFNIDPADGEGRRDALQALLDHPRLRDTAPRDTAPTRPQIGVNADHRGDTALDTADWADDGPGDLRVSYILADARLHVADSGLLWPKPGAGSRHALVWADLLSDPNRYPKAQ